MKRVSFAEEMPEAHKNSKTVSDYRTKYDTDHSVEFGQYNGENDIAANLEYIANIITQLVAVTIYHLFNVEDKKKRHEEVFPEEVKQFSSLALELL